MLFRSGSICKCKDIALHSECLSQWLKSKVLIRKRHPVISYYWKNFECEVCKSQYPEVIRLPNNEVLKVLFFEKPQENYIVLKTVNAINYNEVHVISLGTKTCFKIGRGTFNEIILDDSSISRIHAELRVYSRKCYITNVYSKFGLLTQVHYPISLKLDEPVMIKNGSKILKLVLKCPRSCFGSKKKVIENKDDEYQIMIKNFAGSSR